MNPPEQLRFQVLHHKTKVAILPRKTDQTDPSTVNPYQIVMKTGTTV